jgi:hypothetical protein
MERRARHKAVTYVVMNPYARRAAEYMLHEFDRTVLRRAGVREVGTTTRVLYGATRIGGRVASKAVPVVGWVSLGYDLVQFGRWVHERRQ